MSTVSPAGPPDNVHVVDREDTFVCWVSCPVCRGRFRISREQFEGEEPIRCGGHYTATVDLREWAE